ncbi:DUF4369 domain-containing protein [Labilibaculum antarcticum]|uniref:DUF4369 domain-containing protein n=1 Tax=Labilibaculum antarcticum TaxID=1717717 RepID=A0A1Y1CH05_9BACT|nr:DUF4369 domain-containing protein [Labilibaculum antarcticum]BAX79570.1 hypothetical protein ALGA_1184 [Labilibaculum antarcticum]
MKNLFLVSLFISISIFKANSQEKEFVLSGMIGGIQDETLFLYQETGENVILLDSVMTKNGEFQFSGKMEHPFVAQIGLAKSRRAKIFLSPSKMNLLVHKDELKDDFLSKKLTGSETQNRYEDYEFKLQTNNHEKLKIANDLELREVYSDSIKKNTLLAKYKRLNKFKKEYFHNYASSPVVSYLIFQEYFGAKCSLDDVKEYLKTLNIANPNGMYVKNLNKRVETIEQIFMKNEFPDLRSITLKGKEFNFADRKAKYHLFYIWRAWTPDKNKSHYQALNQLQINCKTTGIELVSLIRNSSYNMIPAEGAKKWKQWRPTLDPSHEYIEIESIDNSVDLIKYLDRNFHAFIVNSEGKILYHQTTFDTNLLISELAKFVSMP